MTAPHADDSTLVAAYRGGDDAALTALIERHQAAVYRLALGVLASREEAEDATQEAFMAMLTSLPGFRGDSRFSTWLHRLALNTCLKRSRWKGRRAAEHSPSELSTASDCSEGQPDVQAGRRWARDLVARFLAVLPEAYRLLVVLSDALNLRAPEIAAILDLSLPAVKARILRGRGRLRAEIERYCREAGLSGWRELVS